MSELNFYYKTKNQQARVLNYALDTVQTMTLTDVYKLKKRYFIFKGYECTDEGLRQYANDFMIWTNELKNDKLFKIDYTSFQSHESITLKYFEKLAKTKNDKLLYTNFNNHESIDSTEYKWIESCYNAGLTYCKAGTYDNCNGYDFSSQYPTILSSKTFKIPTKRGIEQTIKELPKSIQVGFYKVHIISNDIRFKKIFAFSNKHVYTNISLVFAMMCKTKYNYDINIELIQCENNCYIYGSNSKEHITTGNNIFGYWFDVIKGLKERHPKNKLIKNMSSALWGRIGQNNIIYKTEQEAEDEDIDYLDNYNVNHDYYIRDSFFNKKGEEVFELVSCKQPYKYSIARIKPFLLAQSRALTGKIAREYIDSVVRIHTDNVTFDTEHDDVMDKVEQGFILTKELKTTGKIHFVRPGCYKHYTNSKYTTKNYESYEKNQIIEDDNDE